MIVSEIALVPVRFRQRKEHISVTIRAWNELARGTLRTKIAWTERASSLISLSKIPLAARCPTIIGHRRFLIRLTHANATDVQIHAASGTHLREMRFRYPVTRWLGNSTRRRMKNEKKKKNVENGATLQKYAYNILRIVKGVRIIFLNRKIFYAQLRWETATIFMDVYRFSMMQ